MRNKYIGVLLLILAALGGVYFVLDSADRGPQSQPKTYVWDIKDTDIEHVVISLPRQAKSQAFIKIPEGDKFPWHFDDGPKTPVDSNRWGGGIPLILSGPGADRIIADNASPDQLASYGLAQPAMKIAITMTDKKALTIQVGDSTPNGKNYYVRVEGSNKVATVDASWYAALEGLVKNPPVAPR